MTDWTDESVEILTDRWVRGWSAAQIAVLLPFSRNAVIGKITRMKLTRQPGVRAKPGPEVQVKPRVKVAPRPAPAPREPSSTPTAPASAGVTLYELTKTTCRWPSGFPGDDNFLFCGDPTADLIAGKPYCPFHTRMARR